ncbi:hypothetical protein F5Y02DRAFT_377433 [Annulohypoxylon stygium]|nr:hypothetical protein F5Y02DRAFT_377433 [Annulohypoxylon stygium]
MIRASSLFWISTGGMCQTLPTTHGKRVVGPAPTQRIVHYAYARIYILLTNLGSETDLLLGNAGKNMDGRTTPDPAAGWLGDMQADRAVGRSAHDQDRVGISPGCRR